MDIELTEERMLIAAQATIVGANPARAQALYDQWRKVASRGQPHDVDAFLAIAMLIANYIHGLECPDRRRVETAKLFALAHYMVELAGRSGAAVN